MTMTMEQALRILKKRGPWTPADEAKVKRDQVGRFAESVASFSAAPSRPPRSPRSRNVRPAGRGPATSVDDVLAATVVRFDHKDKTSLPEIEHRSLLGYKAMDYQWMNADLRASKGSMARIPEDDRQYFEAIDAVHARSPLRRDVIVHRSIDDASSVFGAAAAGSLVGKGWTEHGYVSTSADPKVAEGFGTQQQVTMRVRVPKGTGAVQLSGREYESELLLQRGLKLKVTADSGPGANPRMLDVEVVAA
jgi:hypothetical protein